MIVRSVGDYRRECSDIDVVVLAAGFEERAAELLSKGGFKTTAHLVLILFENEVPGNAAIGGKYLEIAASTFELERVHKLYLRDNDVVRMVNEFRQLIVSFPANVSKIATDISGMPAYVIFAILNVIREQHPYQNQLIFYTSASVYTPSKAEYDALSARQPDEIEYIPSSMALGMSENKIFEPFGGYRSGNSKSCLALFAGYEPHRSSGVVDAVNPTIMPLMYGKPPSKELEWRLDLSRRLHQKFERTRRCAVEMVSTQNINECLAVLEEYYNYIIGDYELTISPVCSKLQTIASFIFWERYPEVQITFPLPIGYDPQRSPKGIGETYVLEIPGRLTFSRSGNA